MPNSCWATKKKSGQSRRPRKSDEGDPWIAENAKALIEFQLRQILVVVPPARKQRSGGHRVSLVAIYRWISIVIAIWPEITIV